MKWILRLLGLVGILVLLAVIVGVYLAMTFDPNAYKDRIEDKVAEVTGRELTLAGSIELTLFPSLGLRLEDVRLANAEGFTETPFAEVRVVDVAVAVLPLIRGEIEVQRVEADGVSIHLARDAQGRSNWDDLIERAEEARSDAVEEHGNAGSGRARAAFDDIQIAGLEVTNLRLEWDDRQAGTRVLLAPLNLLVRGFRPGMETPVKLDGSMRIEEESIAIRPAASRAGAGGQCASGNGSCPRPAGVGGPGRAPVRAFLGPASHGADRRSRNRRGRARTARRASQQHLQSAYGDRKPGAPAPRYCGFGRPQAYSH
ncbi:MAG: AsmA family protein [Thioalkalivibrio sp.]|nr:AsmA family protein [Thioalkalivibrio sp.]